MDGAGEHVADVAGGGEVSRDLAMVPAPLVSTLGHAVARQRLRAMLLGEADEPVRVDRFALRRELGQGGMGTVWLAHDTQLDREVALKFLRRSADGEEAERRLLDEAKSLAKLSHPHVVPVYDAGRHEGRVWVAMEFVPGRTLRAWVEAERPSPRQRLEAWGEAGRGLAAVHAAGLVHRDVKPDNVLRGDDGRVRLVDFGLVRRVEAGSGRGEEGLQTLPGSGARAGASLVDGDRPASEPRTQTGQFLGTPAYAAPEQRAGGRVDARSDQFSYCVSVWEALCGERPSPEQLPERRGGLLPLPSGARMSGRVRRVLSQGLCKDPAMRFSSMDELLATLAPRRGRWVAAAVAGTGALGVTLGLLAAPSEAVAEPCTNAGRAIDERWTDERREAVAQALGEELGPLAVDALDDYAERWQDAARQSCEEVEVEQLRSPRSLDVRRACLEAQLEELRVLVQALQPSAIESIGPWLDALDEPEVCLSEALLDGEEQTIASEHQPALHQILRELFAIRLGVGEPSLDARRASAHALRERVRTLGHRGTEGKVAAVEGELAHRAGDAIAAHQRFGEALDLGMEIDDATVVADAWLGLAIVALELDVDLQRGDWILQREQQTLRTLGEPPRRTARALLQRGRWHFIRGELDQAEATIERAVAMLGDQGPSASWLLASASRHLAHVAAAAGRAKQAVALHEQARRYEGLGQAFDTTGTPARGDDLVGKGESQMAAGALEDAAATLGAALDALRAERGPRSVDVAMAHVALAAVHDARGAPTQAGEHALRADRILRESHGIAHPGRVHALSALGTIEFREEHFARAVELYERALALAEIQPDASPVDLAMHRANHGEALHRAGDVARAQRVLEQAVDDLDASLGPDDPRVAVPRKALAEVLLERGDATVARSCFEHALRVLTQHGTSPLEQAETRWGLARALMAVGEPEAAVEAATMAASELAALGPSWREREQAILAWIEKRRNGSR